MINLLCEHCLVSGFVDQQKVIGPGIVEAVALDFDLGDTRLSGAMTVAGASGKSTDNSDLVAALRSLAKLADNLQQTEEKTVPTKGIYDPNS